MKNKPRFTKEQLEYIKDHYATTDTEVMAKHLGCTIQRIYKRAQSMGLSKAMGYKNPRKAGQFKTGHSTHNKNLPQHLWITPQGRERSQCTQFKKGHTTHTCKPIGYEVVRDGIIRVKVGQPKIYVKKHHLLWQQYHGEIPTGSIVRFKDGNPMNCTIDNLYLMRKADMMKLENATYARYSQDVQQIIHLKSVLSRYINQAINNKIHTSQ